MGLNQEWICTKCWQAKGKITMYKGELFCFECFVNVANLDLCDKEDVLKLWRARSR